MTTETKEILKFCLNSMGEMMVYDGQTGALTHEEVVNYMHHLDEDDIEVINAHDVYQKELGSAEFRFYAGRYFGGRRYAHIQNEFVIKPDDEKTMKAIDEYCQTFSMEKNLMDADYGEDGDLHLWEVWFEFEPHLVTFMDVKTKKEVMLDYIKSSKRLLNSIHQVF